MALKKRFAYKSIASYRSHIVTVIIRNTSQVFQKEIDCAIHYELQTETEVSKIFFLFTKTCYQFFFTQIIAKENEVSTLSVS